MSPIHEYAQSLAALAGTDFEDEVCARLQSVILSFQTVPSSPHGDAGLDGFSHDGERGYCCYGPKHDQFKTNKQRENAIVDKFKSDLRWVCELDFERKQLISVNNPEMCTILPDGRTLKHIFLLVNWFESHRILNPILTAFAEYRATSACRYVDANASVVVIGPKELAQQYAVDEATIIRVSQRIVALRVQQAACSVTIDNPEDFESKLAILREIRPDQLAAIDVLADRLSADWRISLAFEHELDETVPTLHRMLEDNRQRILRRVSQLMLASNAPWQELGKASDIAFELLNKDFGRLYGSLVQDVSSGEVARLIGECPVGWERPVPSHG